jgi:NADPH2:quinone reductase
MSAYEVMQIGTAGYTAALAIHRMEQNGQTPNSGPILVTGASGGVGSVAINMLSSIGYEVVALTGKTDKLDYLKTIGAHRVLLRDDLDYGKRPLEKAVWGGAIDNVGGDLLAWLTRTIRAGGNIASVGLAGGSHLNTTVMPFILRGISVLGINAPECSISTRIHLWDRLVNDLAPKHIEKIVKNVVELEDLPSVFEKMLAGETIGRTVVSINPDKEL